MQGVWDPYFPHYDSASQSNDSKILPASQIRLTSDPPVQLLARTRQFNTKFYQPSATRNELRLRITSSACNLDIFAGTLHTAKPTVFIANNESQT